MESSNCQSTYYNYKATEIMQQELSYNINSYSSINVCNYAVNTDGKYPFLKFILTNLNMKLTFPKIIIENINIEKNELIDICKENTYKSLLMNEEVYDCIKFVGFYVNNNNLYIFFDITTCKVILNDIYKNNTNWFVLIDEIINHKNICNIPINNKITNLFMNNISLCYLTNKQLENYEIPIVSFVSKKKNLLHYNYSFGEFAKNKSELFGAYYYFTNFNNAINQCIEQNLDGIVRYVLFMGKTKYIEYIETNFTTKEDLNNYIKKDNENWKDTYDSIYAGEFKINEDIYLKNTPFLVIKDYYQQIPLSYHYANKLTKNGII